MGADDSGCDDVWPARIRQPGRLLAAARHSRQTQRAVHRGVERRRAREVSRDLKALVERKWDLLGHGMYNTRFICGLSEAEERAYYLDMLRIARELTGIEMNGMGGPGPQAATENTPDLLAETGFLYYADFFHDDQPFPINVKSGKLISMPYSVEVNDVPIFSTAYEADAYLEIVRRQFDRLYAEGGRVMCITVHPAVIGQAQRAKYVDLALQYVKSFPDVWFATGRQIAEHYMANHYDTVVERIKTWRWATR